MKRIIYFLLLCSSLYSFGQKKKDAFLSEANGNPTYYGISRPHSNCSVLLRVDERTKWISFSNPESSDSLKNNVFLGEAKKIHLEMRIHKDSLRYYRYSVIENDSVYLVDDAILSNINFKWPKESDFPNYFTMSLGDYNVVGKKIIVKVYKLPQKFKVNTIVIYNQPLLPPKVLIKNLFSESINTKGLSVSEMTRLMIKRGRKSFFLKRQPFNNGETIIVSDSIKLMSIGIENTGVNFIYKVKITRYGSDYPEETVLTTSDWDNSYVSVDAEYFKKPGTYKVSIAPEICRSLDLPRGISWTLPQTSFEFTVIEKKEKLFTSRELLLVSVIIGALCGIISVLILNNRKKKAAKVIAQKSQEKEIAKLKLDSVRSQLNPHFLFNALAGIQTLMNKNEIDNANRYLTKFARLTRNVLDHKDLISLTSEKTVLDDYLQMEQLRFGFQYQITASADLDVENIEIPAMLLQPFVENAVKHGIAGKGNDGKIEISFTKQQTDLILSVKDNGNGFDVEKDYAGLGLALTKNRISLLNSIYKETPFLLDMKADANGTLIRITINQWL
ncbi:sensor histidine kinase [Pedobacter sp. KBS0701]|uniref:sensor histidine kinase n=1 Tax=Pedobacter sp. KBS0701 TaxID=2578106 RepID=UPI00110DABAE|nr:histidine kinase [Pedobacter sp. KBS0701]QDW27547.1 sensor histidine kinase [Pedobacter sp. KBS0701]